MSSNYNEFDGNVSPVNNNSSADSKLTEFILRKAQELKIRKFGQICGGAHRAKWPYCRDFDYRCA